MNDAFTLFLVLEFNDEAKYVMHAMIESKNTILNYDPLRYSHKIKEISCLSHIILMEE